MNHLIKTSGSTALWDGRAPECISKAGLHCPLKGACFCQLFSGSCIFFIYLMTICDRWTEDGPVNWELCISTSCFATTEQSLVTADKAPNCQSILLHSPSLVNKTPRYWNTPPLDKNTKLKGEFHFFLLENHGLRLRETVSCWQLHTLLQIAPVHT